MSRQETPPTPPKREPSDEYGFDPDRDPLHADEAQAEAAEYGMYGYVDEAGRALGEDPTEEPDESRRGPTETTSED